VFLLGLKSDRDKIIRIRKTELVTGGRCRVKNRHLSLRCDGNLASGLGMCYSNERFYILKKDCYSLLIFSPQDILNSQASAPKEFWSTEDRDLFGNSNLHSPDSSKELLQELFYPSLYKFSFVTPYTALTVSRPHFYLPKTSHELSTPTPPTP
jgi:hypothetical protein